MLKRMAGPFIAIPRDVLHRLLKLHVQTERLYLSVCTHFIIAENWSASGEWVIGSFRAKKADMIRNAGISAGSFYRTCWPDLQKHDLMIEDEEREGIFLLPNYKRKIDANVSPEHIRRLEMRIEELEKNRPPPPEKAKKRENGPPDEEKGCLSQSQKAENGKNEKSDLPLTEAMLPLTEASISLLDLEKRSRGAPTPSIEGIYDTSQDVCQNEGKKEGDGAFQKDMEEEKKAGAIWAELPETEKALTKALRERGVKLQKAIDVVRKHRGNGFEQIRANLRSLDASIRAGEHIVNPAAVLIWRIENVDAAELPAEKRKAAQEKEAAAMQAKRAELEQIAKAEAADEATHYRIQKEMRRMADSLGIPFKEAKWQP